MNKWIIVCDECGEKQTFEDAKAITYAHWTIIAWKVKSGDPLCLCPECEYGKPKDKKKEKKT